MVQTHVLFSDTRFPTRNPVFAQKFATVDVTSQKEKEEESMLLMYQEEAPSGGSSGNVEADSAT